MFLCQAGGARGVRRVWRVCLVGGAGATLLLVLRSRACWPWAVGLPVPLVWGLEGHSWAWGCLGGPAELDRGPAGGRGSSVAVWRANSEREQLTSVIVVPVDVLGRLGRPRGPAGAARGPTGGKGARGMRGVDVTLSLWYFPASYQVFSNLWS